MSTAEESKSSLLPSALQASLSQVIERANKSAAGIRVILLSTTEGVPLGRIFSTSRGGEDGLDNETLSSLESVWAPPSKQFSVMGLDKPMQVTAVYDHGVLVHMYQSPVVVTILCMPQANLGAVRATAIPLLHQVLEPLCTTLVNSLKPEAEYEGETYYQ